jgi:hypothetical protein
MYPFTSKLMPTLSFSKPGTNILSKHCQIHFTFHNITLQSVQCYVTYNSTNQAVLKLQRNVVSFIELINRIENKSVSVWRQMKITSRTNAFPNVMDAIGPDFTTLLSFSERRSLRSEGLVRPDRHSKRSQCVKWQVKQPVGTESRDAT